MSEQDGLRDLICPTGCCGTEFTRSPSGLFDEYEDTLQAVECNRCHFVFWMYKSLDDYDQQREDMKRVNNVRE